MSLNEELTSSKFMVRLHEEKQDDSFSYYREKQAKPFIQYCRKPF